MSTLKVGGIRGVSASSDAITVANDGTCTAKITNNLSNRNFAHNGDMRISQRGSSFTATGDEYTLDRFKHSSGSSFNFDTTTTQESSGPDGFGNSLKITPDSVVTPSGGENGTIEHYIEGQDVQGLAFGTSSAKSVTVSFYAKSAASNANDQYTLWLQFYNSAGNRFIQNKAFTVTASWQKFSITFTGNTSENIINNNTLGLRLGWILSSGPDDIAAEKTSWEDSNFWMAVTGQSNFMDNTSNEFHLSGVQVEAGDVATDFEHKSYSDEFARCCRYFYAIKGDNNDVPGFMVAVRNIDTANFCRSAPYPMRTIPAYTGSGDCWVYSSNNSAVFDLSVLQLTLMTTEANPTIFSLQAANTLSSMGDWGDGVLQFKEDGCTMYFSAEL